MLRPPDPLGLRTSAARLAAAIVLVLAAGCGGGDDAPKAAASAIFDPPSYACRQILVTYRGAPLAPAKVTRSKAEAADRAQALAAKARMNDADFAALAREASDETNTAEEGGFIGFVREWPGMARGLVEAAAKTPEGGVSDPVETEYGFHVVERLSRAEGMRLEAQYIAVIDGFFVGWHDVNPEVPETRTKEVAYADAAAVVVGLREKRETLEEAGAKGDQTTVLHDSLRANAAAPGFEALARAAVAVKPGEFGNPVETPFGWAVFTRRPYFRTRVRHILILHKQSNVEKKPKDRSVGEAEGLAAQARLALADDMSNWPALVQKYSDEPGSAKNGGSMGDASNASPLSQRMTPELEAKIASMKPGEVSGPFPSRVGYHILWRVD